MNRNLKMPEDFEPISDEQKPNFESPEFVVDKQAEKRRKRAFIAWGVLAEIGGIMGWVFLDDASLTMKIGFGTLNVAGVLLFYEALANGRIRDSGEYYRGKHGQQLPIQDLVAVEDENGETTYE